MSLGLRLLTPLASCPSPYLVACPIISGFAYSLPARRQRLLWRPCLPQTKMVVHGSSPPIHTSHAASQHACLVLIPTTTSRMMSRAMLRQLRGSQKDMGFKAHSQVPIVYECDGRLRRKLSGFPKRRTGVGELGSAKSRAITSAPFSLDTEGRAEMAAPMV